MEKSMELDFFGGVSIKYFTDNPETFQGYPEYFHEFYARVCVKKKT